MIASRLFGRMPDGAPVMAHTLRNGALTATFIDLGAALQALQCPDSHGAIADVVLGFDSLEGYFAGQYFGAVVGRYANRIAQGRFPLDGRSYVLGCNNGVNHLHGGAGGFDQRLWRAETASSADGPALRMVRTSPDGEEGYPGALQIAVTYTLAADALHIEFEAETDAPTIVNLAHHAYFNLAGHAAGPVTDHDLQIEADGYTPVDSGLIPEGPVATVADTPFDFRHPKRIGRDIDADHVQIARGRGYDHNFALREGGGFRRVALLSEPSSGRRMAVFSDQPGLQFYSGNFLDGSLTGKGGVPYRFRGGLCLETQHFPDSPNRPDFPSTRLDPGAQFRSRTTLQFSAA